MTRILTRRYRIMWRIRVVYIQLRKHAGCESIRVLERSRPAKGRRVVCLFCGIIGGGTAHGILYTTSLVLHESLFWCLLFGAMYEQEFELLLTRVETEDHS